MLIIGTKSNTLAAAAIQAPTTMRRVQTLHILSLFLHARVELLRLVVILHIVNLVKKVGIFDPKHLILEQGLVGPLTVTLFALLWLSGSLGGAASLAMFVGRGEELHLCRVC